MKAETPRPSKGCARGAALCAHELKAPTLSKAYGGRVPRFCFVAAFSLNGGLPAVPRARAIPRTRL